MNEEYKEYDEDDFQETNTSNCEACGAQYLFNPILKKLQCPFCGTTKDVDLKDYTSEIDFASLLNQDQNWKKVTHVYQCVKCGSKEVLAVGEISTKCSFCGTSNVVEVDELPGTKPTGIVPFAIDLEKTQELARAFKKRKFFAPKDFKEDRNQEQLSGIYTPVFTFDTQASAKYHGRLGKRYTTTRRVNGKTITQTHIRYFNIRGNFSNFYDDISVVASGNINQKYLNELQPFNTNLSNKYNDSFLFGFKASQYTKDGVVCWGEAKQAILKSMRASILRGYTYDVVQSFHMDPHCDDIKYKYLLLPIYIGAYNYKDKLYNFYVNGTTGKVTGQTPISILKVFILILIIVLFIGFWFLLYWLMKNGG